MRRLITMILTIGLVGASAGLATAEEPSTSPEPADHRVEVPDAGYALTLPEGWTIQTEEVVEQVDSPDGPTKETHSTWSYAFAPGGSASCLLLPDQLEGSLDETAATHRSRYEPVLVEMSSVDLPLGRAVRFVLDYAGIGDEGVGAVYLLSDGDSLTVMSCIAPQPPDDDWWLPLARTIEFLPEDSRATVAHVLVSRRAVAMSRRPIP